MKKYQIVEIVILSIIFILGCVQKPEPKILTCRDGTEYGECSLEKPKFCDNGILIGNCSLCGCPSSIFYDCQDNGNCNKKIYQYPNCRGITCNGFCYNSRFEMDCIENSFVEADSFIPEIRPCRDDSDCKSYVYNERTIKTYCDEATHRCNPYGIGGIDVELKVPESVPINSEFSFTLSITNKNDYSMDFQINPPDFHNQVGALCPEDGTELCYRYKNESNIRQITLDPQEQSNLVYKIKTGDPSMISQIIIGSNFFDVYSNPIIVYDPSKSTAKCDNKIYNKGGQAICIDDILYPIQYIPREKSRIRACYSNDDCDSGICFDHFCVPVYLDDFEPDKFYKISVTPFYLSKDANEVGEQKKNVSLIINKMIKNANEWFKNEKNYWNATSNFSIEYDIMECNIGRNEYIKILKESRSVKDAFNNITKKCLIDRKEYSIVAFVYVHGKEFDQELANEMSKKGIKTAAAGRNFGDVITTGYESYPVLIHETLHSFGMFDIYASSGTYAANYHFLDCLLFRARWNQFEKNPHLCPIEAFVIGWFKPEKA